MAGIFTFSSSQSDQGPYVYGHLQWKISLFLFMYTKLIIHKYLWKHLSIIILLLFWSYSPRGTFELYTVSS